MERDDFTRKAEIPTGKNSTCRHKKARLGGIEPPHLPPEGSALSTELQTCITCIPEKEVSSLECISYVNTNSGKSKEII